MAQTNIQDHSALEEAIWSMGYTPESRSHMFGRVAATEGDNEARKLARYLRGLGFAASASRHWVHASNKA